MDFERRIRLSLWQWLLMPPLFALPTAALTAQGVRRAIHGQLLEHADFAAPPAPDVACAWLSPEGALVAVGAASGERWSVLRGFRGPGDAATERGSEESKNET